MTEEDNRPNSNTILEALMHAVKHVLGISRFAASGGFDGFGGELFYIYLPPESDDHILEHLSDRIDSEEDRKVFVELLPTAKNDFDNSLHQKIRQALEDLTQESLFPFYQATGKRYGRRSIEYDSRNSQTKGGRLVKIELKDGIVVRRVVKKHEAGRPSQWTPARLERDVKRAATKIVKWNSKVRLADRKKLTIDNVAEEMNKLRDDQTQLTADAVKQALTRNGLKWGDIKRAVIGN
jgi:hypothetical protein